jgi:hypothetical protein
MSKKLQLTDKIKKAIIRSTGDEEFNFSNVSVFETACFNTLPVNKRGLFEGARSTEATLHEMATYVNEEGFVPMHTMHAQGWELPVGRVFAGEVHPDKNGIPTLHAMFYIGNDEKTATGSSLVEAVDNGSIDEVSVGLATKHLNCSVCGFDYLGADATPDNIYGYVCNEGHEIGVDGTHLQLSGMARWLETSLVSLGAAKNAKILSRTKSLMGAESYEKLAASGVSPEITTLFASHKITTPKPEKPKMDLEKLVTLNATLSGEKAVLDHKVITLTEDNTKLKTELTASQAKVTELETQLTAAKSTDAEKLKTELTAAQAAATAQLAFVRSEADRLCVAAGATKLADDASFDQLKASIEENRVKLAAAFGGKTDGPGAGSSEDGKAKVSKPSAYKIS